MSMTKEKALNTIAALLQHTETDCDYAYDNADGSVDLLPGQDITDALRLAITAIREQEERRWIPVTERMPEEHDSIFAKFHGTSRWEPCMFRTESDWVLANVVYQDGKSVVRELRTTDGGWALGHAYGVKAVTHWRPLPQPPKEGAG